MHLLQSSSATHRWAVNWLDFSVFETVDQYNEQFYGLTEHAEEFVDQLDQTRIGRSFLPDVMVCPPRPHSKHSSGGYIGAAHDPKEL